VAKTLLEWMGFPDREAVHRDLLAWLLQEHDTSLLAPVLPGLKALEPNSIRKEVRLGPRSIKTPLDRLDLRFATDDAIVGVEVKVKAGESPGQLRKYADALAADPDVRPKILLFMTETGVVPECPDCLVGRHPSVRIVFGTWDRIVANATLTDALGWCDAIRERARCVDAERALLEGDAPLLPIDVKSDWHLHARAIRDFARDIVDSVGDAALGIVHGPVPGQLTGKKHVLVDMGKRSWHKAVGQVPGLADVNPFLDDDVRFTARIRLQLPPSGRLQLAVGGGILPYSRGLPGAFAARVQALEGLSDTLARRLSIALGEVPGGFATQAWRVAKVLGDVPAPPKTSKTKRKRPANPKRPPFDGARPVSVKGVVVEIV
jgi:hypothetical protein